MSDTVTRQSRDQRTDGPQLYASGRRVAIRATDADGRRTDSFAVYDVDHDATTNLPDLPGLIRLEGGDDSELVLVQDLRAWVETHRAELQAAAPRGLSCRLLWGCPEPAALEGIYRASRGTLGALRTGRPTSVTALRDAPNGWGLYRITKPSGEIYVGISSNVRNRLYAHQGAGRLHLSAGDTVEALSARQPGAGGVVTWADLQEAERFHIRKLRGRGHTLINVVGGGNGMPPGSRFNVPDDDGVELANPSQIAPRLTWSTALEWNQGQRAETEHEVPVVALHTIYARTTGDWDLWLVLDPDQQVWAQPHGTGEAHEIDPGRINWIQPDTLRRLYAAQSHCRNLDTDLAALQPPVQLSSGVPIRYWRPDAGQLDDAGRVRPPAQALCAVTAHDVRTRTLPDDVLAAGITIDPDYRRPSGLNEVVRVRTPAGTHLYLKIEENPAAARAELLASLLWHRMGWPGIGERVLLSDDRQVLIIPPVGGVGGIADWGNFNQAFAGYSFEQDGVTLNAERAGAIRRVPLHVLNLDDPDDVLRFVTMNAGWGNTDRHVNNVHFGWRTDPAAPDGGHGYLLPLDHGRCFFNNDPNRAGQRINGSPAAAVTGRISNPHQLLRAFADRAAVDPDEAAAVVADWARTVRAVVTELAKDPEWGECAAELGAMGSRLGAVAADPAGFVTACRKVVLQ